MKSLVSSLLLLLASTASFAQQGWVQLSGVPPEGGSCIQAVNKDTVWMAGFALYRTSNGGDTWDSVGVPGNWTEGFSAIRFVNDSLGYLTPNKTSFNNPPLLKTIDGGHNWSQIMTGNVRLDHIMTMGPDSIWTLSLFDVSCSYDAGSNWYPAKLDTMTDLVNCGVFSDNKTGHLFGNAMPLPDHSKPASAWYAQSTDAGRTWHYHYAGISKDIYSVTAASQTTLIAAGDAMIARSTNNGDTWDTIPPTWLGRGGFYGGTFVDSLHGTLVGYAGLIAHTSDGGVTWVRQNSGVGYPLGSVSFVDTNLGYATGGEQNDGGGILKTTNGGVSWVKISPARTTLEASAYPQPATQSATISYVLPETQYVTINLYDCTGTRVMSIPGRSPAAAGKDELTIDVSSLPAGTYIYEILGDCNYGTGKLIVTKLF